MERYLEFKNINKTYPGVHALKNVSFRIEGGKVTALMGENGAGKSTLLKILNGDVRPDTGSIIINGVTHKFSTPIDAIRSSISVIYQERQLVPSLSVMENVFLENLPVKRFGIVDRAELKRRTQEIIDTFDLQIDPTELVGRLSVAHQQMVEIMKAYRRDSLIFAFDEPTSSLTDTEIKVLFDLIRKLKAAGKIIMYVSHRMHEVFEVTDEIVILKDGQMVKTVTTSETSESELISAMVGRDVGDTYASLSRNDKIGDVILEVKNLTTDAVKDVSFTLHRGEVLGFAGLVGSGRTEVMRAIFGADPIISGEIIVDGQQVCFKEPYEAIEHGIALCPEDRKEQGLVLPRSIKDNITIPVLEKLQKGLFMDKRQELDVTEDAIKRYSIRTPSPYKVVAELSGGNQQKVILGRWTSNRMSTKILILDEPTKGIDVGTKAEIYQIVCDYAKDGKGVIFISSELTEVINLCDNIIVMQNGAIKGKIARENATEESIMTLAMAK